MMNNRIMSVCLSVDEFFKTYPNNFSLTKMILTMFKAFVLNKVYKF